MTSSSSASSSSIPNWLNDDWIWNYNQIRNQRTMWTYTPGLINSFPRPQGNLPASEWLYKKDITPKVMNDFNKSNMFNSLYGTLTFTDQEKNNLLSRTN